MNKSYTLKTDSRNVEEIKSNIIQDLNQRIGARQDCKVMITPLDFRGMNALRAYWMMIDRIVEWDSQEGGNQLKKNYFHNEFMKEAGLYDMVDNIKYWKMKYKKELKEGWEFFFWHDDESYDLIKYLEELKEDGERQEDWETKIPLGQQYTHIIRSIANKGDVNKDEMSRLLTEVLKFGAKNEVPDCFIADLELQNMLKSYER